MKDILDLILSIGVLLYFIAYIFSLIDAWRNGQSWQKKIMLILGSVYCLIYSIISYTNPKIKPIVILLNYSGLLLIIVYVILLNQ